MIVHFNPESIRWRSAFSFSTSTWLSAFNIGAGAAAESTFLFGLGSK